MTTSLSERKLGVVLLTVALGISTTQNIHYILLYLLQGLLIVLLARGSAGAWHILVIWYLSFLPVRFKAIAYVDLLHARLEIIQWTAVSVILQAVGLVCLASQRRFLAGLIVGCLIFSGYLVVRFPAGLDTGLILAVPAYVAMPCGLSVLLGRILNSKLMVNIWHIGGLLPAVLLLFSISGIVPIFFGSELSKTSGFEKIWMICGVMGLLFTVVNWPKSRHRPSITNDGSGQKTAI